jgi:hypothetical protein
MVRRKLHYVSSCITRSDAFAQYRKRSDLNNADSFVGHMNMERDELSLANNLKFTVDVKVNSLHGAQSERGTRSCESFLVCQKNGHTYPGEAKYVTYRTVSPRSPRGC